MTITVGLYQHSVALLNEAGQDDSGNIIIPTLKPTAGQGGPGRVSRVFDAVYPTATQTATPAYELCRFPTGAMIQSVYTVSKGIDSSGTPAAVFDVNVMFSDVVGGWSTYNSGVAGNGDNTPAALAGTLPNLAQIGGVTTLTAYTNPNKLFGKFTVSVDGALQSAELLYNGTSSFSINPWLGTAAPGTVLAPTGGYGGIGGQGPNMPLWAFFGFTGLASGMPMDPGGQFQLLFLLNTPSAVSATGEIIVRLDYVI